MTGVLCLTCLILSLSNTNAAEESKPNKDIAIADFANISKEPKLNEFSKSIPEWIFNHLANSQKLSLVTRNQLEALLSEPALAEVGIVDAQTAVEVGRMAGARYMFIGTLSLRGLAGEDANIPMAIGAQLVEVESGRVIGGWQMKCDKTNVYDIAEKLTKNILRKLFPLSGPSAAVRSLVIPGWGQRSNGLISGYFFATGSVAAIGGVIATQVMLSNAEKDKGDVIPAEKTKELDDKRLRRNIALIALASVWGLNVIDAYVESHLLAKSRRPITERVVSFGVGADAKSIAMMVRF